METTCLFNQLLCVAFEVTFTVEAAAAVTAVTCAGPCPVQPAVEAEN